MKFFSQFLIALAIIAAFVSQAMGFNNYNSYKYNAYNNSHITDIANNNKVSGGVENL